MNVSAVDVGLSAKSMVSQSDVKHYKWQDLCDPLVFSPGQFRG